MLNTFFKIKTIVFISIIGLFSSTLYAQETTTDDPFVLVIDPGHGGADAGTLGTRRTKIYEKHVVLDVALKLEKLIKDNMKDVKILMTRRTDVYPTLQSRARLANKNHAHLFLSIHCNAAANPQATGAETLVMATERASANLEISKRENAYIVLEENHQENYKNFNINDPLANIGKSLEQFSTIRSSIVFADLTQKYMCSTGGRKDRHIVQAIIYVTYACTCPSVLVELGFLTNPAEEAFLHSEKGQNAMALALFQAFKDYKARTYDISHPTAEVESSPAPMAEPTPAAPVDKIEYCVQLTSSSKALGTRTNVLLRRFSDVTYFKEGNMYKYTTRRVSSYAQALKDLSDARKKGAKDAFIIAFKNKEKVNVNTARSMTGE